jgi:hypothetical protein
VSTKKIKLESAIETATDVAGMEVAGTDNKVNITFADEGNDSQRIEQIERISGHAEAVNSNSLSPIGEQIMAAVERFGKAFSDFKSGELTLVALADLIDDMVRAANTIIPERGQGAIKHAEVVAVFVTLDKRYGIIDKIDRAVPLPFYLEPIDGPVIKLIIDVMIKTSVTFANKHGW